MTEDCTQRSRGEKTYIPLREKVAYGTGQAAALAVTRHRVLSVPAPRACASREVGTPEARRAEEKAVCISSPSFLYFR